MEGFKDTAEPYRQPDIHIGVLRRSLNFSAKRRNTKSSFNSRRQGGGKPVKDSPERQPGECFKDHWEADVANQQGQERRGRVNGLHLTTKVKVT